MPAPTFDTFLFDLFSQLSGGLVTDIKTMLAGLLLIGVILVGADLLFEKLGGAFTALGGQKHFQAAERYRSMRDSSAADSMDYDYYNALYRRHLNATADSGFKTGKYFSPKNSGSFGSSSEEVLEDSLATQTFEPDSDFDDSSDGSSSNFFRDSPDDFQEASFSDDYSIEGEDTFLDDIGFDREAFWDDDRL